jgi:segregation and condensation protein B
MPSESLISPDDEKLRAQSDEAEPVSVPQKRLQQFRHDEDEPIIIAHAMTAEEDNRLQSKPLASAEPAGDEQSSEVEQGRPGSGRSESGESSPRDSRPDTESPLAAVQDDRQEGDDISEQPQENASIGTEQEEEPSVVPPTGSDDTDHGNQAEGDRLKHIVEAALLAAGKPLSIDRLLTLFLDDEQPDRKTIRTALETLQQEYRGRGIEVREVSTGWRIQVRKEHAPWVSRLWEEKPGRYSRALLETLSLIAYRQPITRGEIEDVRGVAVSTNIIKTLLERDWVRVVGHRDVPGRPALYATTREFLDYFGLKSLDELPTLAEIRELEELNPSLDLPEPEQNASEESQQEHSENRVDAGDTDAALSGDITTEEQQQDDPDVGASADEGLVEQQDERLH